jgi:hypothetical protein
MDIRKPCQQKTRPIDYISGSNHTEIPKKPHTGPDKFAKNLAVANRPPMTSVSLIKLMIFISLPHVRQDSGSISHAFSHQLKRLFWDMLSNRTMNSVAVKTWKFFRPPLLLRWVFFDL